MEQEQEKEQTQEQIKIYNNVSSTFNQSLTEEQLFLQQIYNNEIKTYSHEDVVNSVRKMFSNHLWL